MTKGEILVLLRNPNTSKIRPGFYDLYNKIQHLKFSESDLEMVAKNVIERLRQDEIKRQQKKKTTFRF